MNLRVRLFLAIIGPLVLVVSATTFFTARATSDSMLGQMEQDGLAIAQMLAQSANFASRVPGRAEEVLANQMVVEARTMAELVAVAEKQAGMSPKEINAILNDIAAHTTLDEIWISDENGHVYLTNTGTDFTFSPNPQEQPQAYVFYTLLGQQDGTMIQEAAPRSLDSSVFKYVGVSGVDKPRIVQVGYRASILEQLSKDLNAQKLVDDLTGQGNVVNIRLLDGYGRLVAGSTQPTRDTGQTISEDDRRMVDDAAASHQVRSALREGLLRVAAPVISQEGRTQMVALVYIATDSVQQAIRDEILRALLISLAAILVGVLISILFSRGITRPVAILTDAASALEADNPFNSERLVALAANGDELGKMARVFARMAKEIHVREDRLKSQVAQLKIEIDEAKRARQVQEITDTDYFQSLRGRAQQLRTRKDE